MLDNLRNFVLNGVLVENLMQILRMPDMDVFLRGHDSILIRSTRPNLWPRDNSQSSCHFPNSFRPGVIIWMDRR